MKILYGFLFFCFLGSFTLAQDSDFVRAKKTLDQIDNGIKYLKRGDVASYNDLSAKLTSARSLLEATKSKTHKDYKGLVNRWNAQKNSLVKIADEWKNPKPAPKAAAPKPVVPAKPANVPKTVQQNSTAVKSTPAQQVSKAKLYELNERISVAVDKANFVNNANPKDINKINNIAGKYMYDPNKKIFKEGLESLAFEASIGSPVDRSGKKEIIEAAQKKLEEMRVSYIANQKIAATKPKKKKKKSTSQMLWLDGSRFCEITKKGQVWINSNKVGDIESNGKIWVKGNRAGSIEKNGKVWHNGNHVGTIEDNGKVWKRGSQVGSITKDGKVWIGSSSRGSIVGDGDWRRAAIIYYFDFF
ncbi:MAG: hypothetical protein D8M58_08795 [Calditrichaeota bacterium]|nr:MAG: hypothetical protein DWQ03_17695 [Calditrichota bacterium]MBL1205481.1 hypothetical protein [Calditrichota bacterium]NOG45309.1 hypothetical protein [Calditrichota bacterium]